METLNERLTNAFNILIERGVFFKKYNSNVFVKCPDEQLQFVTNFLSMSDMKIILSVCDLFSLDFGIHEVPSLKGQNLSVIFRDFNG